MVSNFCLKQSKKLKKQKMETLILEKKFANVREHAINSEGNGLLITVYTLDWSRYSTTTTSYMTQTKITANKITWLLY